VPRILFEDQILLAAKSKKADNFVWLHFWKLSCLLQRARLHIQCQYRIFRIRDFKLRTSVAVKIRVIPKASSMQRCETRMRLWRLLRSFASLLAGSVALFYFYAVISTLILWCKKLILNARHVEVTLVIFLKLHVRRS